MSRNQSPVNPKISFHEVWLVFVCRAFLSVMSVPAHSEHLALPFPKLQGSLPGLADATLLLPTPGVLYSPEDTNHTASKCMTLCVFHSQGSQRHWMSPGPELEKEVSRLRG